VDQTILVVDDDPLIRTLVCRILTRGGYQVGEAADGREALKQVAIARPDLVLADLMMPVMNGDELVARLMSGSGSIPCILMSAFHTPPAVDGVPFLAKPFAVTSLLDLVAEMLPTRTESFPCRKR
jgi:CheY-like chemotaxis protein